MELFIFTDPLIKSDEQHWFKEHMKDKEENDEKAEMREWIDLDVFEEWLTEEKVTDLHVDYYFFRFNEEFYKFLCICNDKGIKRIEFDSNDFVIEDFEHAISLAYLMS